MARNLSPIRPPLSPHFDFSALPAVQVRETFARVEGGVKTIYAGVSHGGWGGDEIVWNERGGHWSSEVPEPREDKFLDPAEGLAAFKGVQELRFVVAGLSIQGATRELYQGETLLRAASGAVLNAISSLANPYPSGTDYFAKAATQWQLYDALTGALVSQSASIGVVPDGSYVLWANAGAEWSAIRVRVGVGAWARGASVYPGPGAPLYRKSASVAEVVVTAVSQASFLYAFDEMARAVSASCVTHTAIRTLDGQFEVPANSLLIAGLRASENGPQTALWLLREDGTARLLAASPTFSDGRCECAKTNHHASDIGQAPDGRLFILSECNLSIYDPNGATEWERLQPFPASSDGHPGGQCLRFPASDNSAMPPTVTDESEVVFFTENFGGVNDGLAWYNRLVRRVGGRDHSGPSTLWHGPCCAEVFQGQLWGVRGEKSDGQTTLFLDRIVQGRWDGFSGLKRVTVGKEAELGEPLPAIEKWQRLRRAGANLWVFGWRRGAGVALGSEVPVTRVTRGNTLDEAALPFFVRRATPFNETVRPTLLLCARAEADGIGVANRVIELTDAGGDGGTRVCSFWDAPTSEFRLTRSAFVAAGGDVAKLPAFFAWFSSIGTNGGGFWRASATQPPALPYLTTVAGAEILSFALSGVSPYAISLYDELCFEVRTDGSTVGPDIEPSCGDAACVFPELPTGTRWGVETRTVPANGRALTSWQLTDRSDRDASGFGRLQRERDVYPSLWFRVDSNAPFDDLASYNQICNYGRLIQLQRDARLKVEVLYFVTPANFGLRERELPAIARIA